MIDLSEICHMSEASKHGAARAALVGPYDIDKKLEWFRGRTSRIPVFKQNEGRLFYDVVGTTIVTDLISDRVVDAVCAAGLTGLISCPVQLLDRHGHEVPGYGHIGTTGRCGPLDPTRSQKITGRRHENGNPMPDVWKGFYFDEKSWDGADFFAPVGTTLLLATARAQKFIATIKTTNVSFFPLLEFTRFKEVP